MVDPVLALSVFGAAVLTAVLVFWPRAGLLHRALRLWRTSARVRHEDVLKQLYMLEYEGLPATAESVSGGTGLSRHPILKILQSLDELEFVEPDGSMYRLTDEGRSYALRILRTHRLWERYLADRTGTRPEEWHALAEAREHTLSEGATENLASSLGHPLYDPHGDPIPTAAGELPAQSGFPLSSLRVGEAGIITHLEDEPSALYRELVGLGLGPLVSVERIDGPKGRVRFRAAGAEHEIDAVVARNVTVETVQDVGEDVWRSSLADVPIGASAAVVAIAPTCQGPARRRLLDLGLVPGTVVTARMRSAAGDPVAYEIRGALIALRREQAAVIQVDQDVPDAGHGKGDAVPAAPQREVAS
ncbi:MAG: FeoA domain-containing protein [Gemmatimonadota bacterium]|nr:FeoA domain-containing protein [Gemmatimonadota bacterium]